MNRSSLIICKIARNVGLIFAVRDTDPSGASAVGEDENIRGSARTRNVRHRGHRRVRVAAGEQPASLAIEFARAENKRVGTVAGTVTRVRSPRLPLKDRFTRTCAGTFRDHCSTSLFAS